MATKRSNTSAIAKATGRSWEHWLQKLEDADARKLAHKDIALAAQKHMPAELENPEWWAQSVAVAFEQHIGRRLPGQGQDGTFQGSTTATVHDNLDGSLERWVQATKNLQTFNGQDLVNGPSISSSERWRYWRASFSDGTKTQVDIGRKGDKSTIAVNITKASSPEAVAEWKEFWRSILAQAKS